MPSLYGEAEDDVVVDLPDYDHRRLLAAKDPLAAVHAFWTWIQKVFAPLYGLRVCPSCPHCSESSKPCSDSFGSNATPLGGSAGRADAAIGACEAQKAEGVLHIHLYIFFQCAHQFLTLFEIAEKIRNQAVFCRTIQELYKFHSCSGLSRYR